MIMWIIEILQYTQGVSKLNVKPQRDDSIDNNYHEKNFKKSL